MLSGGYTKKLVDINERSFLVQIVNFENGNFISSISYLERAISIYPKSVGRFHLLLGEMYLKNKEIESSLKHAIIAQNINPDHQAPKQLIKLINSKK